MNIWIVAGNPFFCHNGGMSEPGKVDSSKKSQFSRRDFLKLLSAGAGAVLGNYIHEKTPFLKEIWEMNGFLLTGEIGDVSQITSEVPPQLKDKDIPKENAQFRNFDNLLEDSFAIYEEWRKDAPDLEKLSYKKPDNYVDVPSLTYKLAQNLPTLEQRIKEDEYYWYVGYGLDVINSYDEPYSMFTESSASSIKSVKNLVTSDPGTGFVSKLRESMHEQFGQDFDVWSACRYDLLSDEQYAYIQNAFTVWYANAKKYVSTERDRSGEPLSSSVLYAYFLHENNGDILKSAWDTTNWLKITARNDVDHDLKRDPNYDRAKMIFHLFKDEFSPTISGNWVVDNVSPNDTELNFVEDPDVYYQYKDFMPPNRAGIYHSWNVFALTLQMSPALLKRAVATNILPTKLENGDVWTEYGRVKTWADLLVAQRAEEMKKIVSRYES